MTDDELPKFELVFKRAYLAAQARWKGEDYSERLGIYFRRLRRAPFDDVAQAVATWFDSEKRFPSVAEWLATLPNSDTHEAPADCRMMGASEQAEWDSARRRLYAGDICGCLACLEAGVVDRPRRFVPIENREGALLVAWHQGRKELVPIGEWIHGWELARWYAARADFVDAMKRCAPAIRIALVKLVPFEERIDALFTDRRQREPGEEG